MYVLQTDRLAGCTPTVYSGCPWDRHLAQDLGDRRFVFWNTTNSLFLAIADTVPCHHHPSHLVIPISPIMHDVLLFNYPSWFPESIDNAAKSYNKHSHDFFLVGRCTKYSSLWTSSFGSKRLPAIDISRFGMNGRQRVPPKESGRSYNSYFKFLNWTRVPWKDVVPSGFSHDFQSRRPE